MRDSVVLNLLWTQNFSVAKNDTNFSSEAFVQIIFTCPGSASNFYLSYKGQLKSQALQPNFLRLLPPHWTFTTTWSLNNILLWHATDYSHTTHIGYTRKLMNTENTNNNKTILVIWIAKTLTHRVTFLKKCNIHKKIQIFSLMVQLQPFIFLRFIYLGGEGQRERKSLSRFPTERQSLTRAGLMQADLTTLWSWPEPKSTVSHSINWATQAPQKLLLKRGSKSSEKFTWVLFY